MRELDLAQVADELYELAPADFTAARDERARQARDAGQRDAGDAIRKLRRPTVSAWMVNRLAREAADQVGRLLALGQSLREAQQSLAADRLRELSAQRRQLVQALIREAKRLAADAGRPVSGEAEREVEATLDAALADPAAADAVRSGRLTTALSYAGFGEVDIDRAVAVPRAAAERTPPPARIPPERALPERTPPERTLPERARREGAGTPSGGTGRLDEQRAAEERAAEERRVAADRKLREAAEHDLREADAAAGEARATLDDAERQVTGAREEHQAALLRIEDLERQLERALARDAQAARAVRDAQRSRDVAARAFDLAQRLAARARAKIDRLG